MIPYQTAKFKFANIFAKVIWGPTTKFNSCANISAYTVHPYVVCTKLVATLEAHNELRLILWLLGKFCFNLWSEVLVNHPYELQLLPTAPCYIGPKYSGTQPT